MKVPWMPCTPCTIKVSPGGFVIVDDYGALTACKRAIHDFRTARNIFDPMITIDHDSVSWQKTLPNLQAVRNEW